MTRFDQLPEGAKENLIAAMIQIAIGDDGEKLRKLINQIGIDEDQKALLQRAIVSQLYEKKEEIDGEGIQNSLPVRNENLDSQNPSLTYVIQKLCDLEDVLPQTGNTIKSKIYEKLQELTSTSTTPPTKSGYWNESVDDLVLNIKKMIEDYQAIDRDDTPLLKTSGGETISTIGDLREADAGHTFEIQEGQEMEDVEWVRPFKNIDNKSYNDIRKHDQILDILTDSNKLDRTKKQKNDGSQEERDTSFISLLMPRYGRRVQIEDLDRNFWVIAQIVDGMSSWIFEESPFTDIIKQLLDETTQLWENILYLWLELALISQKKGNDVLALTCPVKMVRSEDLFNYESIPVAEVSFTKTFPPIREIKIPKFNFMDKTIDLKEKESPNPLEDLDETYAEQDLCYVSRIKTNNYRKNYHSGEWFDKVYLSLLNGVAADGVLKKRDLVVYTIKEVYDGNKQRELLISADPEFDEDNRFTPYLTCATYSNGKYLIGYPFSETSHYLTRGKREVLYCGINAEPVIKIERNLNGKKEISSFEIRVYDAIDRIFSSGYEKRVKRLIGKYVMKQTNGSEILMEYVPNSQLGAPNSFNISEGQNIFSRYTLAEKSWDDVSLSYYLGDLISYKEKTARVSSERSIIEPTAIMLKIGNFLPEGIKKGKDYTDNTEKDFPDYPVPTIVMNAQCGLASQFRGDFTFQGIPKYFNKPAENTSQDDFNLERATNGAFGENSYEGVIKPGALCYYYFDWSTYLPNKDIPGEPVDETAQGIGTMEDGLCFESTAALHYKKAFGETVTKDFIKEQSVSAVQNFILRTKYFGGYYSNLYKKVCYFTTFIGLAPYMNGVDDIIKQKINAACYLIKYIPSPDSLDRKENGNKEYQNYKNFYDGYTEDGVIVEGLQVLGKFSIVGLINRYDSYYDYGDFRIQYLTDGNNPINPQNLDLYWGGANEERRLMITNLDYDICNSFVENNSINIYTVDLHKEFQGKLRYYDLKKAETNRTNLKNLLLGKAEDIYQISEASVKIQNEYSQIEEGRIYKCDGTSFYTRVVNNNLYPQAININNTGLMKNNGENRRETPIFYNFIIDNNTLTPAIFGMTDGDLMNVNYKYDNVDGQGNKEVPSTPFDSDNSNDYIILPKQILIINTPSFTQTINGEDVEFYKKYYATYDTDPLQEAVASIEKQSKAPISVIIVNKNGSDRLAYKNLIASAKQENKSAKEKNWTFYYFDNETPWRAEINKDHDNTYFINVQTNRQEHQVQYYLINNASESQIGEMIVNTEEMQNSGVITGSCEATVSYAENSKDFFKLKLNTTNNICLYMENKSPSANPGQDVGENKKVVVVYKDRQDNSCATVFEEKDIGKRCSKEARNALSFYGKDIIELDGTSKPTIKEVISVITVNSTDVLDYIIENDFYIYLNDNDNILLTKYERYIDTELPNYYIYASEELPTKGSSIPGPHDYTIILRELSDELVYSSLRDIDHFDSEPLIYQVTKPSGTAIILDGYTYYQRISAASPQWDKEKREELHFIVDGYKNERYFNICGVSGKYEYQADEQTQNSIHYIPVRFSPNDDHIFNAPSNFYLDSFNFINDRPLPDAIYWTQADLSSLGLSSETKIKYKLQNSIVDLEFYKKLILDYEHKYEFLTLQIKIDGNYKNIEANVLKDWTIYQQLDTVNATLIKSNNDNFILRVDI